MSSYYELKRVLEQIYKVIDTVDESGIKPDYMQQSLRDIFKIELHSYFMYLSASDGQVSAAETEFMNCLFDMNVSSQDYANFINENNIYSTDFEEKLPLTLQILKEFDVKMSSVMQANGGEATYISPLVVKFYADAGKAFLTCDGTTQSEVDEIESYIQGLTSKLMQRCEDASNNNYSNNGSAIVGGKKVVPLIITLQHHHKTLMDLRCIKSGWIFLQENIKCFHMEGKDILQYVQMQTAIIL